MAAHDRPLDLVSVASMLATAAIGGELAEAIGAYAVILACGIAGAGYGLARWRTCTRFEGVAYVLGWTVIAAATAVPLAELAVWTWPTLDRRWFIAPAAIAVSGIGHDWPAVVPWLLDKLQALRGGGMSSGGPSQ